jgi:FAD/FMN-containing dehydrogenase
MSWVEFVLYNSGYSSNSSLDVLLNRTPQYITNFKAKSDYVKKPMPEIAFEGIWKRFLKVGIETPRLVLVPYGGKMDQISESSIPFAHRAGNLYKIQYLLLWNEQGKEASMRHIAWIRRLYSYTAPYVSKNPREAYINYRDLDVGMNNIQGNTSYKQASIWGRKYFKNNFDRLIQVKTAVDPDNFFRNEQSIPPLSSS